MIDCIFCKIVAGEVPADKVYEDENVVAFLDIAPVNKGHTLLIPKAHSVDLLDMPPESLQALMAVLPHVARGVLAGSGAPAFNVGLNNGGAAGQVVMHTHFHIMPRFADDGYKLWGHKDYQPGEAKELAEQIRQALEQ